MSPPPREGTVRAGRGRPRLGVRPRRRSNGKYEIVFLDGSTRQLDTRSGKVAWAAANEAATQAKAPADPADVTLGVVIAECGDRIARSHKAHLLAFFADLPLMALSRDACWAYQDMRLEEVSEVAKRTPSLVSIAAELASLRTMINRYGERHGPTVPDVYIPEHDPRRREFLKVREIERMLTVAVNGWDWDFETSDWRRNADGTFWSHGEAWLGEVYPMQRAIPLLGLTGSRTSAVWRAIWRPDSGPGGLSPQPRCPHIDLRVGNFNRRGAGEQPGKKRRPPVRLAPQLLAQAWDWWKADRAADVKYVVHQRDGRPLYSVWRQFAMVRRAAGLPENITTRALRASCGVWLVEAGCTPEEAAAFIGNTAAVFSDFYDRYASEFSWAAADALDSRTYAIDTAEKAQIKARLALGAQHFKPTNIVAKTPGKERER